LTTQAYSDNTLIAPVTVKLIMDTWTLKKGYPVVTLERDYVNNKVKLTQKWFLLNPERQSIEGTEKWYIPFTHTTQRGSMNDFIFEATPYWLKPDDNEGKAD
jgi:aminopeptidase N